MIGVKLDHTDVHISYLPLPHVYERFVGYGMTYFGGKIMFYSGDVTKLKDDL